MASAGDGSNGTPASMKREGTMQRTVREAKECSYGCNCGEIEGEHDHDQVTGQPVMKPVRQTTMEKTAQEGIRFLKDQRKDTLLEVQGLIPLRNKGGHATAGSDEEGNSTPHEDVEDDEEDDEEDTTEPTGGDDDDDDLNGQDDSNSGEAAKMSKQRTMLATMKEGQDLLDNYMGGKLDPNARTRTQQHESSKAQQKDDDEEEDEDGPDAKRPRRTHTMLETTQEAQHVVADPHSMGGTRSETAAVKKAEQHASPSGRQKKQ